MTDDLEELDELLLLVEALLRLDEELDDVTDDLEELDEEELEELDVIDERLLLDEFDEELDEVRDDLEELDDVPLLEEDDLSSIDSNWNDEFGPLQRGPGNSKSAVQKLSTDGTESTPARVSINTAWNIVFSGRAKVTFSADAPST